MPAITFSVTSPEEPPPVIPAPATTPVYREEVETPVAVESVAASSAPKFNTPKSAPSPVADDDDALSYFARLVNTEVWSYAFDVHIKD